MQSKPSKQFLRTFDKIMSALQDKNTVDVMAIAGGVLAEVALNASHSELEARSAAKAMYEYSIAVIDANAGVYFPSGEKH
jgi:hypothetical protein